MDLSRVIDELVENRGLARNTLQGIIEEAMLSAYQKKYPDLQLSAKYDKSRDSVEVFVDKTVVSSVRDSDSEISLRKARSLRDSSVEVGQTLTLPFDGDIGRVDILRARQTIAQKIKAIEAEQVYNEFKPREGEIINGSVHKCEQSGVVVKVQDEFAFLPKSLTIPGEGCVVGRPIRALLKEVLPTPRNESQLILDRSSAEFLSGLFALEVPEVFERLVEIKAVAREAGYKSKIVVSSNDPNIDPVGTCVGVNGARIRPILREIGDEKIDVIAEQGIQESLVKEALRPAEVKSVAIEDGIARVWVDDDQRSLAIGKSGKNIALASRLTGFEIELVQDGTASAAEELFADVDDHSDENTESKE